MKELTEITKRRETLLVRRDKLMAEHKQIVAEVRILDAQIFAARVKAKKLAAEASSGKWGRAEQMLKLHERGKSFREIGKQFEMLASTVQRWCAEAEYRRECVKKRLQVLTAESSVNDADLTVRTANCLNNADINTLGELAGHSEEGMMEYRNFGRRALEETVALLAEAGLKFREETEEEKMQRVARLVRSRRGW